MKKSYSVQTDPPSPVSFGLFCLKTRKSENITFSRLHRWAIYIVGLLETLTLGSCVLGWAQLVYVLKNEDIFLNVCQNATLNDDFEYHILDLNETTIKDHDFLGCEAQDRKFAVIYILSMICYIGSSVFVGMTIHHYGLVFSRILGGLIIGFGFLALGCTTRESPLWLYVAMIMLGVGGNFLRLSGLQFCNLFPKYRSTALTILSGSYAASAGLFILFQVGQDNEFSLWSMSLCLAGVALVSVLITVIMPWHSVPSEDSNQISISKFPLSRSLLSVSSATHIIWFTVHINGIVYYSLYFNPWITQISTTNEEAGFYSSVYSISSFACVLITPLPGLLTDYIFRKASEESNLEVRMLKELKSPALPLILVTFLSISMLICTMFNSPVAIYVSFAVVFTLRAFAMSVGAAFIRIRFPAEHFDRLNGIITAITAIIFPVQYPFFMWIQNNFLVAMLSYIFVMILSLIHPLHLLLNPYMRRVVKERLAAS